MEAGGQASSKNEGPERSGLTRRVGLGGPAVPRLRVQLTHAQWHVK
jgi:hypothetical protein